VQNLRLRCIRHGIALHQGPDVPLPQKHGGEGPEHDRYALHVKKRGADHESIGKQKQLVFTKFAQKLPKDVVILTAGCAKYKYNKLDLGDIGGIPRVLDAGQCNDSYSLALIALKLKEVFGLDDINDLPLAFNIAWYEQKAVIVLLALLYLGVKNIHLGPTLPGFLSPNVAKVLVDNFGIAGIGTVEDDLKLFFGEE
jgi:hydroxylamine reductase